MKKTLAAACLAFVACIPVFARSEPNIVTPALDSLNKDQLIGVIKCLSDQRGDVSQSKINRCIDSVAGQVTIIAPQGGDTLRPGQTYRIAWRGNGGEPFRVSLIKLPTTPSETTSVITIGQTKVGVNTYEFVVPRDLRDGRYQIQFMNRYNVESRSGVFTIETGKQQVKGAVVVVPRNSTIPSETISGTTTLVYSMELMATGTAQSVSRIDFETKVVSTNGSLPIVYENPAVLIKSLTIKDESGRVIASAQIRSDSFTKDSKGVYYSRLMGGLGLDIPVGSSKKVNVYIETNPLDYNRTLTIDGYDVTSILASGPDGVSKAYSFDGPTFAKAIVFKKQVPIVQTENTYALCTDGVDNDNDMTIDMADSDCVPFTVTPATVIVGTTTSPLTGKNIVVSPTLGSQNNPVLRFLVKSTNASSTIKAVTTTILGQKPKSMSLYDSSTNQLYGTVIPSSNSNTVQFDNLMIPVAKNITRYFVIKADFAGDTPAGSSITVVMGGISYNNGVTDSAMPVGITGYKYGLYPAAPNIIFVYSALMDQIDMATSSALSAQFKMQVEAKGSSFAAPIPGDFRIGLIKNGVVSYLDKNSTYYPYIAVTTTPNQPIADGSISDVEVNVHAKFPKQTTLNNYQMFIDAYYWGGQNGTTTQTWGLEALRTPVVTL